MVLANYRTRSCIEQALLEDMHVAAMIEPLQSRSGCFIGDHMNSRWFCAYCIFGMTGHSHCAGDQPIKGSEDFSCWWLIALFGRENQWQLRCNCKYLELQSYIEAGK